MHNRGNFKDGINDKMRQGVLGTVTAINGNIITISNIRGTGTNTTTTTYTVDATNAKITKNNTIGTVTSIIVGDTIMAQGTITGTNVVATNIRDGVLRKDNQDKKNINNETNFNKIVGNGLPVVAGTVTSINGSIVSITNKSNVSYTIDATNAKIQQGASTIAVSNILVGDTLVIQGSVNGNNVIASTIQDQIKPANSNTKMDSQVRMGFFGRIGSFFGSMFGF